MEFTYIGWKIPPDTTGSGRIASNLLEIDGINIYFAGVNSQVTDMQNVCASFEYPDTLIKFLRGVITTTHFLKFIRRESTVIVAYPDWRVMLIGVASALIAECPYSLYCHNLLSENSVGIKKYFAQAIEKAVFRCSECILAMSDGMVKYYLGRNIKVPIISLPHIISSLSLKEKTDKSICYDFGFCGTVNPSCKDALQKFLYAISAFDSTFVGYVNEDSDLTGLPASSAIKWRSESDQKRLMNKLGECLILVLPHGFSGCYPSAEYNTIVPTKLFTYLSVNRPIILLAKDDTYINKLFKRFKIGRVMNKVETGLIYEYLRNARSNMTQDSAIVNRYIMKLYSKQSARERLEWLSKVVAGKVL